MSPAEENSRFFQEKFKMTTENGAYDPQAVPHGAQQLQQASYQVQTLKSRPSIRPGQLAQVEIRRKDYPGIGGFMGAAKPVPDADGTFPAIDERKCRKARANTILLFDPVNYVHVKNARMALDA